MADFGRRNHVLASLTVTLFLGVAVYFRLWSIDYSVSSDESEMLRRQFDLASRELSDESAEWRLRFDHEAEKAVQCMNELNLLKDFSTKNDISAGDIDRKLDILKKENSGLLKQIEALKQALEAEKLKCVSQ